MVMSNISGSTATQADIQALIQRQQSRIEQLQLQLQSKQAKELRIKLPDPFDGTPSDLERFLTQLELYIMYNEASLPTNTNKVMYASTRLKGIVYDWIHPYMDDYLHNTEPNREDETNFLFTKYQRFVDKLKSIFKDKLEKW